MKKDLRRTTALIAGCVAVGLIAASPSEARSHGRSHGHSNFSFSIGIGGYGPYYGPYWGPRYYWPAPAYYDTWRYRPYDDAPVYQTSYAPAYRGGMTATVGLDLFPAPLADHLSDRTQDVYFGAYSQAMAAPVGDTVTWSDGSVSGAVTSTRDGWAGQRYCREFRQTVTVDSRRQEATGTTCRDGNGVWELVPNQR